jgi:hypothetical protein
LALGGLVRRRFSVKLKKLVAKPLKLVETESEPPLGTGLGGLPLLNRGGALAWTALTEGLSAPFIRQRHKVIEYSCVCMCTTFSFGGGKIVNDEGETFPTIGALDVVLVSLKVTGVPSAPTTTLKRSSLWKPATDFPSTKSKRSPIAIVPSLSAAPPGVTLVTTICVSVGP